MVVLSHLDCDDLRPRCDWLQNFAATTGHLDCNFGLYFYAFYPRSKRGFLHSDFGAMVPTAVFGLASTVFPVEVVGRRLFMVVVALGMLVLPVRNMQCAAGVAVRIQTAPVSLYCPYLTWIFVHPTH